MHQQCQHRETDSLKGYEEDEWENKLLLLACMLNNSLYDLTTLHLSLSIKLVFFSLSYIHTHTHFCATIHGVVAHMIHFY